MGALDGRVAVVTGGARGQGRSHALALAREGADVVVCDIAAQIDTVPYPMSGKEDLDETVRLVSDTGVRCLGLVADVRSTADMQDLAELTVRELGRIDVLLANAAIVGHSSVVDLTDEQWQDVIDVNLTGAMKSMRAVVPQMVAQRYGRIVATASMAGRMGVRNIGHYSASKWGLIGLCKTLARELGHTGVTVNVVAPATVETPMVVNQATMKLSLPGVENPTVEQLERTMAGDSLLELPWLQPEHVTRAIMFLVTDPGTISGSVVDVGLGATVTMP